jgi:uncharacterized protein YegJ (DUF2314 family)
MTIIEDLVAAGPHTASLTFYLKGDDAPDLNVCLKRLNAKFSFDSTEEVQDGDEMTAGALWHRALRVQDYPFPFILLCFERPALLNDGSEPFRPIVDKLWPEEAKTGLKESQYQFQIVTLLHHDNPQPAYGLTLQVGALLAGHNLAGCLDHESMRIRMPDEVYDLTASSAPPSISELFTVVLLPSAASTNAEAGNGRLNMITRGLRRCLRPELALLEIDAHYQERATTLLKGAAGVFLLDGVPEPGQVYYLNQAPPLITSLPFDHLNQQVIPGVPEPQFTLALLPAEPLQENTIITSEWNDGDLARWADHLTADLNRLNLDYITPYESKIREEQARERLSLLRNIWEQEELADQLEFLFKVGFEIEETEGEQTESVESDNVATEEEATPIDKTSRLSPLEELEALARGDESGDETPAENAGAAQEEQPKKIRREHLWFRIVDLHDDAFQGELVSTPYELDSLTEGEQSWHKLEEVSDWLVRSEDGSTAGPQEMIALRRLLRK